MTTQTKTETMIEWPKEARMMMTNLEDRKPAKNTILDGRIQTKEAAIEAGIDTQEKAVVAFKAKKITVAVYMMIRNNSTKAEEEARAQEQLKEQDRQFRKAAHMM